MFFFGSRAHAPCKVRGFLKFQILLNYYLNSMSLIWPRMILSRGRSVHFRLCAPEHSICWGVFTLEGRRAYPFPSSQGSECKTLLTSEKELLISVYMLCRTCVCTCMVKARCWHQVSFSIRDPLVSVLQHPELWLQILHTASFSHSFLETWTWASCLHSRHAGDWAISLL